MLLCHDSIQKSIGNKKVVILNNYFYITYFLFTQNNLVELALEIKEKLESHLLPQKVLENL